uniref:rRNA N-glycosylase n=1 Tax=Oryza meridionalis TaxID=40149 RepID=A0A0E0D5C4_9ORYZ
MKTAKDKGKGVVQYDEGSLGEGSGLSADEGSLGEGSGVSANHEDTHDIFELDFTDIINSLQSIWSGVRDGIKKRNAQRPDLGLVDGKMFLPETEDTFLIKMILDKENDADSVSALFKYKDLYLDSIHSGGVWYRFIDSSAVLPIPSPKPEYRFKFSGSYDEQNGVPGLDCNVDSEDVRIGTSVQDLCKTYDTLKNMDENLLTEYGIKLIKEGLLFLIALGAESLRFPLLEHWILTTMRVSGPEEMKQMLSLMKGNDWILEKHHTWERQSSTRYIHGIHRYFRCWGKISDLVHKGRGTSTEQDRLPTLTYQEARDLLGVLKRFNTAAAKKKANRQKKRLQCRRNNMNK